MMKNENQFVNVDGTGIGLFFAEITNNKKREVGGAGRLEFRDDDDVSYDVIFFNDGLFYITKQRNKIQTQAIRWHWR
jgi:hypothetical protein